MGCALLPKALCHNANAPTCRLAGAISLDLGSLARIRILLVPKELGGKSPGNCSILLPTYYSRGKRERPRFKTTNRLPRLYGA